MEMEDFTIDWFVNEIATSVEIGPENIELIDYYEGSVIAEYSL